LPIMEDGSMSYVTTKQPDGTPTWIDLGIPDLDRAMEFYGSVFGWTFDVGPAESGHYTMCVLDGRRAAAITPNTDPDANSFWWNVYFATSDCDATTARITESGGRIVVPPMDIMEQGRVAMAKDPVGAQFGLWQANQFVGCEVVNEPGARLRNDLVTPNPGPAREFYAAVFGLTNDRNSDFEAARDFTFLRRPDGHEIGGISGETGATTSAWDVLFEVADTDDVVAKARAAGGTADDPFDMMYGRLAAIRDPFGAEFTVGARPSSRS
jgi:predicted enzyme related to lactoylglutathione lyase